jgi:predicted nucleic acid-binding protein
LLAQFPIAPFDASALIIFQERTLFSQPIGRPDRLLASIALAGGHVLVTRNTAHFRFIPGLQIENWIDDPCP